MEAVLWCVLTGTRGGENRIRILRAVEQRPRNANRLADELELDYKTVRHHLDVLTDNDMIEKNGDDYGAVYLPSDRVRHHRDVVGDTARVTVVDAAGPVVVDDSPAMDPDGDGQFEDVNGDGDVTPGDATVLFDEAF